MSIAIFMLLVALACLAAPMIMLALVCSVIAKRDTAAMELHE